MNQSTRRTARRQGVVLSAGLVASSLLVACGGLADSDALSGEHHAPVSDAGARVTPNVEAPEPEATPVDEQDALFEDPGCPTELTPVREMLCDPFDPVATCSFGQACRPFVEYPASPCEPERFGARCDWPGTGTQGSPCSTGACAPGFLCVASAQGTQCAQLCAIPGESGCPAGLLCGSIDIEGLGTCF